MYDEGISTSGDLLDLAVAENRSWTNPGAWFSYGDVTRLGQGRENSKRLILANNPDLFDEIRRGVLRRSRKCPRCRR